MRSETFILIPRRSTGQGTSVGDRSSDQYRGVTRTLRVNPADLARLGLYGGEPGSLPTSRVRELVDYVDAHSNISVDIGQVVFGDTASLTGAGPLGYFHHGVTGRKWFNGDIELEEDCGIIKDGAVVVEDGEIREPQEGRSYHAEPPYDAGILPELRKWFADPEYLARPERVATAAPAG